MKQHEDSIRILCPCCGKRMFDTKQGLEGFISIKCERCKRVATYTFKCGSIIARKGIGTTTE